MADMKISVSVPDELWDSAASLGSGPSEIVQEALRRATDGDQPAWEADVSDSDRVRLECAVIAVRQRLRAERNNGFQMGLRLAEGMSSHDAQLIRRSSAVGEVQKLLHTAGGVPLEEYSSTRRDSFSESIVEQLNRLDHSDVALLGIHWFNDPETGEVLEDNDALYEKNVEVKDLGTGAVVLQTSDVVPPSGVRLEVDQDGRRRPLVSESYAEGVLHAMKFVWNQAISDEVPASDTPTDEEN